MPLETTNSVVGQARLASWLGPVQLKKHFLFVPVNSWTINRLDNGAVWLNFRPTGARNYSVIRSTHAIDGIEIVAGIYVCAIVISVRLGTERGAESERRAREIKAIKDSSRKEIARVSDEEALLIVVYNFNSERTRVREVEKCFVIGTTR